MAEINHSISILDNKKKQHWFVKRLLTRKKACCCSCKATMPEGKISVMVDGLFIPDKQRFAVVRTFYFCCDVRCTSKRPMRSNLLRPQNLMVSEDSHLSSSDMDLIKTRGFVLAA